MPSVQQVRQDSGPPLPPASDRPSPDSVRQEPVRSVLPAVPASDPQEPPGSVPRRAPRAW
ncbi:hypothetical protein GCM10010523_24310 [Paenarthrobacter ilicis]